MRRCSPGRRTAVGRESSQHLGRAGCDESYFHWWNSGIGNCRPESGPENDPVSVPESDLGNGFGSGLGLGLMADNSLVGRFPYTLMILGNCFEYSHNR